MSLMNTIRIGAVATLGALLGCNAIIGLDLGEPEGVVASSGVATGGAGGDGGQGVTTTTGGTGGTPGTGGNPGTGGTAGAGGVGGAGGAGGAGGGAGGAGGGVVCADAAYPLSEASPINIVDDTTSAANDTAAQGCGAVGQTSGELIYAVTPNASGMATAEFSGLFTAVVYVRSDCDDQASEIMCFEGSMLTYDFIVVGGMT